MNEGKAKTENQHWDDGPAERIINSLNQLRDAIDSSGVTFEVFFVSVNVHLKIIRRTMSKRAFYRYRGRLKKMGLLQSPQRD